MLQRGFGDLLPLGDRERRELAGTAEHEDAIAPPSLKNGIRSRNSPSSNLFLESPGVTTAT